MKIKIIICMIISFITINSNISYSKSNGNEDTIDSIFYYRISQTNRFYYVINLKVKNYCGKVAITNMKLFGLFFLNDKKISNEQYRKRVVNSLLNNDTLSLEKNDTLPLWDSIRTEIMVVTSNQLVDSIAELGKENFLEYFFKNRTKNQGELNRTLFNQMTLFERRRIESAIIEKLFQWRIFCLKPDNSDVLTYFIELSEIPKL